MPENIDKKYDENYKTKASVQTDSRLISPGDIFIAYKGENLDGHDYIQKAINLGAEIIICERESTSAVPQVIVEDSITALAKLAQYHVSLLKKNGLQVIAVTGSNGKTTTKSMLQHILSANANVVAPISSYNNEVGAPLTVLRCDSNTDYLIVEMGANKKGDIKYLSEIAQPDVGAVLMVGLAHSQGFISIDNTASTKAELVQYIKDGLVVLNNDNEYTRAMISQTNSKVINFGLNISSDVSARDIVLYSDGTRFTLIYKQNHYKVFIPILGEHHVYNFLAAYIIAKHFGYSNEQIIESIKKWVMPEKWRMQIMRNSEKNNITIINDAYNASPESVIAAVKTLAQITNNNQRSIAVIGEMSELGDNHGQSQDNIGALVVRLRISKLVVVGNNARRLYISAINEGSWGNECSFFENSDQAYEYLISEIRNDDVVLIKSSNVAGLRFLGDKLGEHFL